MVPSSNNLMHMTNQISQGTNFIYFTVQLSISGPVLCRKRVSLTYHTQCRLKSVLIERMVIANNNNIPYEINDVLFFCFLVSEPTTNGIWQVYRTSHWNKRKKRP